MIPIVDRAHAHSESTAIISSGEMYSYKHLLDRSVSISRCLLKEKNDLAESRIAFMMEPGLGYTAVQWGIWRAGGVCVPLSLSYPLPSLQYVIEVSASDVVICEEKYQSLLSDFIHTTGRTLIVYKEISDEIGNLPDLDPSRDAMILYTSGTTGSPKGVVTTHENITAQIESLVKAWEWASKDHILNILPLHHVHGIINVLSCALWSGARCEFLDKFDVKAIFSAFLQERINVFMAVPTIYYKLISEWETYDDDVKQRIYEILSSFRLMVSGSAALPVSVMEKWEKISGHKLLERYGMTEIGMALSNSYRGNREPGHVGMPLPGVTIRLYDDENKVSEFGPGEIQVKGNSVFSRYWNREKATKETFTEDGWFKTGDIAELDKSGYRILGRSSVDIIKSGGYKISALEIEETSRKFDDIKDCAVVGIPDDEWGELICIGLVSSPSFSWEVYQTWLRDKLPGYKIPRKYIILDDLPRNALGKVTKNEMKHLFTQSS